MKKISFILFVICFVISIIFLSGCSPIMLAGVSREKIPKNIPPDVRKQIEELYSASVPRAYAAHHLGNMGNRATPAVPFLVDILTDRNPLEWKDIHGKKISSTCPGEEAKKALVKIGEPAVEPLIDTLQRRTCFVNQHIAVVLGDIGDTRAVEPLIAELKNKNCVGVFSGVRINAAEALGKIGDTRAVEPLIDALQDKHKFVKKNAKCALVKITGQDFGYDQIKWQNWWNENRNKMFKKQ